MRRRITLYIAGQLCELADDALVLLNIQREDLYNPAIVRNSYTQSVTLPGTPANNRIFDHYFRADHSVGNGFNPLIRVPFLIYSSTGEILVSGYCKLDAVRCTGGVAEYDVTLYGGLGDFIYGLAYDMDGNKKSLASLDYLGGGDAELDFTINKTAVAEAWARLGGDTTKPAMWDVINFAPCYNGIPSGDFDAGKALAIPSEVGLPIPAGYSASADGYTLITLQETVDEWEAHDLRSYLQRPVLSIKALLNAIANPANNGGWGVDLSDISTPAKWPYLNTWITRPLLPSLGTYKQTTGTATVTFNAGGWTTSTSVSSFTVDDAPAGTRLDVRLQFGISYLVPSASGIASLQSWQAVATPQGLGYQQQVLFVQALAYNGNTLVGEGPVKVIYKSADTVGAETVASVLGFHTTAQLIAETDGEYLASGTTFSGEHVINLEVSGVNVTRVSVRVSAGYIYVLPGGSIYSFATVNTVNAPYYALYNGGTAYTPTAATVLNGAGTATSASSDSLRSGALVTKAMLLSTERTPADYLLAICKTFGLYILADDATKSVRIVRRKTLYRDIVTDITPRVDMSQEISMKPLAFDAKWYDFKHEGVGGAFEKEYKETSGRDYGAQRVNTGYDFDASAKDVLGGVVLKSAAAVMARSRFFIEGFKSYEDTAFTGADLSVVGFIRWTDGVVMNTGYHSTDKIFVNEGDIILYAGFSSSANVALIAAYDSLDGYLQSKSLRGGGASPVTFNVPSGVSYIRMCSGDGALSVITGTIRRLASYVPPLFSSPGIKYTLWKGDEGTDYDVAQYFGPTTPMNPDHIGYDVVTRPEFRDKDGKPVDGADVLLFAEDSLGDTAFTSLQSYQLTDDVADMDAIAGNPCWLIGTPPSPLSVPNFSRYVIQTTTPDPLLPSVDSVLRSLDFGIPAELAIPDLTYEGGTIYELGWRSFIHDRLDVNTKVLHCKVDLSGLPVGPELLRRFFWYRGSLWVLNKISNYSLTTFDAAECEFIQVRDKDAYIDNQY